MTPKLEELKATLAGLTDEEREFVLSDMKLYVASCYGNVHGFAVSEKGADALCAQLEGESWELELGTVNTKFQKFATVKYGDGDELVDPDENVDEEGEEDEEDGEDEDWEDEDSEDNDERLKRTKLKRVRKTNGEDEE